MEYVPQVSLAIIAAVYVGLAVVGIVALIILIKLYGNLKKSVDELKREIEPYNSNAKEIVYKAQKIMDAVVEVSDEIKEIGSTAKETSTGIMDKANNAADEVVDLVVDTKKKTETHIQYVFKRVETIEEQIDGVYAFLSGINTVVSKLKKRKE